MKEELGLAVTATALVAANLYKIAVSADEHLGVLVICYLCNVVERVGDFEFEGEAGPAEFQAFPLAEITALPMPSFYKEAIEKACRLQTL